MTIAHTPATDPRRSGAPDELRVTRYDQVSVGMLTTLMVFAVIVGIMFLLWLSSRIDWDRPPPAVQMLEDVGGGGQGDNLTPGEPQEFEEPVPDEIPPDPQPQVESSLEAISTIVSEAPELVVAEQTQGQGQGQGTGMGDGRGPGPGGPGTSDGVPAWERWEVRLSAADLNTYAKQLDFFGVELGVAGGGDPNVRYVSKLSDAKPTVRVGNPKEEKRLRFMHRSGQLRDADRQLVSKAGVDPTGKVVFQFYSPTMYQSLLALENAKMGARRIADVRRTVFGVRESNGKFEFFVIEQAYRDGSSA